MSAAAEHQFALDSEGRLCCIRCDVPKFSDASVEPCDAG